MKKSAGILSLFLCLLVFSQENTLLGAIRLTDYDNTHFDITVKNQRTGITSITNMFRRFSIKANVGDVLFISGENVYENSVTVTQTNVDTKQIVIVMNPIYVELSEIVFRPLSGNLRKDLVGQNPLTETQSILQNLGIPWAITDGRRNTEAVLPSITNLNVDALYDLLSGNSKKRERLYAYEDKQRKLKEIRDYYRIERFTEELQIPENEIDFFVEYVWNTTNCEYYYTKYDFASITQLLEEHSKLYLAEKEKNQKTNP